MKNILISVFIALFYSGLGWCDSKVESKILDQLQRKDFAKRYLALDKIQTQKLNLNLQSPIFQATAEILLFEKAINLRIKAQQTLEKCLDGESLRAWLQSAAKVAIAQECRGRVEVGKLFLKEGFLLEAKSAFTIALSDADSDIRYSAIEAMGQVPDLQALHELAPFLGNSFPSVRALAGQVILKILDGIAMDEGAKQELKSSLKMTHEYQEQDRGRVDKAKNLDDRLNIYPACTLLAVFSQKYEEITLFAKLSDEEVLEFQKKVQEIAGH